MPRSTTMPDGQDQARASAEDSGGPPLLEVERLCVHFRGPGGGGCGVRRAVDDVSFIVRPGETLGILGESGCGKTTLGRAVLRLIPASSGRVVFRDGVNVLSVFEASRRELRRMRRGMQIVFQDPAGSLDPRMTVEEIVGEPLLVHGVARGAALRKRVLDLLDACGLPRDAAGRRPHQFSGGQRQRIGIARAIALKPRLIICDEPTSALDVSVQAQILNLLKDLQREFQASYVFISHDVAVVDHMCDRIAVMKGGRIVELGGRDQVIRRPRDPYTAALIEAAPAGVPRREALGSGVPSR